MKHMKSDVLNTVSGIFTTSWLSSNGYRGTSVNSIDLDASDMNTCYARVLGFGQDNSGLREMIELLKSDLPGIRIKIISEKTSYAQLTFTRINTESLNQDLLMSFITEAIEGTLDVSQTDVRINRMRVMVPPDYPFRNGRRSFHNMDAQRAFIEKRLLQHDPIAVSKIYDTIIMMNGKRTHGFILGLKPGNFAETFGKTAGLAIYMVGNDVMKTDDGTSIHVTKIFIPYSH